jgi:PhnB protein
MAKVKPVPDGYPRLSPALAVHDGNAAIAFYCSVFGATERMRMEAPGGKVGHAELAFGDSVLMLNDEFPESGTTSPKTVGGTPVTLSLYVDDVDDVFKRAIAEGATELRAVEDQFYGDRSGGFLDPFGHRWYIATHIEDVPPDEMAKRAAKAMAEAIDEL